MTFVRFALRLISTVPKELRNLTGINWITLIIGLSGVIFTPFFIDVGVEHRALYTLLSSFTVAGLLDRASRAIADKKTEQQLEALIKLDQGLKRIGGIPAAVDWFVQNADEMVSVRKTVQHPSSKQDKFTPVADKFGAAYTRCLDRGCPWHEIALYGQRDRITEPDTGLTPKQLKNYSASYLDIKVPIPQIMLMEFKHDRRAVMIGFTFDGGNLRDDVFLSEDTNTFEYFNDYFNQLDKLADEIEDLKPLAVPSLPRRGLARFLPGQRRSPQ